MNYVSLRIKIEDYNRWKPLFDEHKSAREDVGLKQLYVWRNIDNKNDIVLLFEVSDIAKANEFFTSADLKVKMQESGVLERTDIVFLSDK